MIEIDGNHSQIEALVQVARKGVKVHRCPMTRGEQCFGPTNG